MLKILVTYYSRSWTTKKLAESIASLLHADCEEIIDTKKRGGLWGFFISGRDAALRKLTKIQTPHQDPSAYDIVMIGTPVWDFTMSAAIRTYLTEYKNTLPKELVFFCTEARTCPEGVFQDMSMLSSKKPIGRIAFINKEITQNTYQEKLSNFLKSLGLLPSL